MKRLFRVGIIRVVTLEDNYLLNLHGKIIEKSFPGIITETKCIPNQHEGIHNEELAQIAIPKIITLAQSFLEKDMIIVSCADDPGVDELREMGIGIPVTGGGESAATLASMYGTKIALLGITENAPKPYLRIIPEKIIDVGKPKGVNSTLDLLSDDGKKNTLKKAMEQKEKGAQVIALSCTGMATIGIAAEIEKYTGLPVIDPVIAEGTFAFFAAMKMIK